MKSTRMCGVCFRTKSVDEYYKNSVQSNGKTYDRNVCKECDKKSAKARGLAKHYRRIKHIAAYKIRKGCQVCGYNAHSDALQFDHIDPTTKKFSISTGSQRSLRALFTEIRKCRILCANCHAVHTCNQRRNGEI